MTTLTFGRERTLPFWAILFGVCLAFGSVPTTAIPPLPAAESLSSCTCEARPSQGLSGGHTLLDMNVCLCCSGQSTLCLPPAIYSTTGGCPAGSCNLGQRLGIAAGGSSPPSNPKPHPAVARIVVTSGATRSYGTGTLIACDSAHAWILTCAHLFSSRVESITVCFPDGRQLSGQLVGIDRTWDLALVRLPPVELTPVPVAEKPPEAGQRLTLCGYGPDGLYRCSSGSLRGYVAIRSGGTFETLSITGAVRQGDSGGPVFDPSGALVGVIWGCDGQTVVATFCGRIRHFLRNLLPSWEPSPPVSPSPAPLPAPSPHLPPETPESSSLARQLQELDRRIGRVEEELGLSQPPGATPSLKLSDRLSQLEAATQSLPALRQKVADAERALGPENLRAIVRDVALGVVADNAPQLLPQVLSRLAEALGWSTPPSIALVLAARFVGRILAQRARRRQITLRQKAAPAINPPGATGNATSHKTPDALS